MKFDIITIFPEIFNSFLKESLLAKAIQKKIIQIKIHNLRDWAQGKHQIVDDTPYGGGPGMVLKIEPIWRSVQSLKSKLKNQKSKVRIIFLSPRGKKFAQKTAQKWAKKLNQLIIISGRYEGVDERVKKIANETISVGDFITLGGEIPAMAIIEAVARLVPGVVGKKASIEKPDFPQYTRPEIFKPKLNSDSATPSPFRKELGGGTFDEQNQKSKIWRVPKILLSGNHKKINEWRKKHSKEIK